MKNRSAKKALVVGVGPEKGLGGALAIRFASEGHRVFIAGRTAEKLAVVAGSAENIIPIVCDATDETSVINLFDTVHSAGEGELDLVVYNVGNSTPGKIREMETTYFVEAWQRLCLGGFLVGRETTKRIPPEGGTLIFTGASASLRGKSGFGAFNSGKAALRNLAQAMAKEYASEGLHVAHVIIDGGIAGDRQFNQPTSRPDTELLKRFISLDSLVDAYWMLYKQPHSGWSFELDLRSAAENW